MDAINAAEMRALEGEAVRYFAQDTGSSPDALRAACPVRSAAALWPTPPPFGRGLQPHELQSNSPCFPVFKPSKLDRFQMELGHVI